MLVRAGTSGFSYKEWKGPFYPQELKADLWLGYYAGRLPTVEINNTFYRMPRSAVMASWAEAVPEGFRFVIKASRRITHFARLKDTEETQQYLWSALEHLGEHQGPVLFQLPPNFKRDDERLSAFLASLPEGRQAVMEFRHASWDDDEVDALLREHRVARCAADSDETPEPRVSATAPFGYLRLRRASYDPTGLQTWADRARAQGWQELYAFFKHEDEGAAPRLAQQFLELFA